MLYTIINYFFLNEHEIYKWDFLNIEFTYCLKWILIRLIKIVKV